MPLLAMWSLLKLVIGCDKTADLESTKPVKPFYSLHSDSLTSNVSVITFCVVLSLILIDPFLFRSGQCLLYITL